MNKSGRRVLRATAAVAGITALGAVGSGTAFADTATNLDGTTDSYGETDLAADDGAGLPTDDTLGGLDLFAFEMPSLGESSVKNQASRENDEHTADKKSDVKKSASKKSDDKKSDDKKSDDEGSDSDDEESDEEESDYDDEGDSGHSSGGLGGLGGLL